MWSFVCDCMSMFELMDTKLCVTVNVHMWVSKLAWMCECSAISNFGDQNYTEDPKSLELFIHSPLHQRKFKKKNQKKCVIQVEINLQRA